MSADLLRISLQAAVPLWIDDMRDWGPERRLRARRACAPAITEEVHTANDFNKLALGIACGAYQPGGITFLGDHWEAGE